MTKKVNPMSKDYVAMGWNAKTSTWDVLNTYTTERGASRSFDRWHTKGWNILWAGSLARAIVMVQHPLQPKGNGASNDAKVIKYLRTVADDFDGYDSMQDEACILRNVAEDIRNGEHLK
jgi:hypothetical protein